MVNKSEIFLYISDVCEAYSGMPKVVVIEIDLNLKPGIYNRYKIGSNIGNSFSSTLLVAKKKGI